jgi:hypothetical protein
MKIFAKRKRKTVDLEGPSTEAEDEKAVVDRVLFQSDKLVEELLKKDPTTWNAKERRMVKRYQDRPKSIPETNEEVPRAPDMELSDQKMPEKQQEEIAVEKSDCEMASKSEDDKEPVYQEVNIDEGGEKNRSRPSGDARQA